MSSFLEGLEKLRAGLNAARDGVPHQGGEDGGYLRGLRAGLLIAVQAVDEQMQDAGANPGAQGEKA